MSQLSAYKSKTIAAWLALLLGGFGVHRLYLHGTTDKLAWLHPIPMSLGLYGLQRMEVLGQDDRLAWLLLPLLGLMLSQAALCAIIYSLTKDANWDARHNAGREGPSSGWGAVLAAVAALLIGGAALMATIAFSAQRYFEFQVATTPDEPTR